MNEKRYFRLLPYCRECRRKMVFLAGTDPFCPKHPNAGSFARRETRNAKESEVVRMS